MIGDVTVKVCGITRAADAAVALAFGADYLGVNCWSGSPRFVPPAQRAGLLREIPADKRIAVTVNPTVAEAEALLAEGFAAVQAHFDPNTRDCDPAALSAALGPQRLWVAPKLADGAVWPADLLKYSHTCLHDAHAKGAFGGTGKQADWTRFQSLQKAHSSHVWILAGGLGPTNVAEAVEASARFLDLNSGVELSPGVKSAEKLAEVRGLLLKNNQS
jgi:phosphoribosylanthranilate isomerase